MIFSDMIDRIFTNPDMGAEASYQAGAFEPVPVRIMVKRPDTVIGFGDGQFHTSQTLFDIRVSDIPNPQTGDKITYKDVIYIVQSEPQADRDRLVWRLDVAPE